MPESSQYVELSTTNFPSPIAQAVGSSSFMDPERIAASFGLTDGMRVADFGSGSGHFAIIMAKMVGDSGLVTAIDLMEFAIETLRAKAKADGLANIQTVRSNLEIMGSSGLADNSQDVVLLANILFQSSNKEMIINEARRVVKPGGAIIVISWRKGVEGFGPPDNLRTDEEEMTRLIISSDGLQLVRQIDAGAFHYGLKFLKI